MRCVEEVENREEKVTLHVQQSNGWLCLNCFTCSSDSFIYFKLSLCSKCPISTPLQPFQFNHGYGFLLETSF